MRKLTGFLALLVFASVITAVAERQHVGADDAKANKPEVLVRKIYHLHDLPIWTKERECRPTVLMQLIESTVSPSDWEGNGGTSSMAPYRQTASLIVSTSLRNHQKVESLLESLRPRDAAK